MAVVVCEARISLARVIARHPTRFRGLCALPLQNEKAAAGELDRCVKKLGFKGILLYTNLAGRWCDEPPFRWLYARAEELGGQILVPVSPEVREGTMAVVADPTGALLVLQNWTQ